MAKLHVEVTQEDIDEGCRNDAFGEEGGCMVHRALMRASEGAFEGLIVSYDVAITGAGGILKFPEGVRSHIIAFDAKRPVAPFAFDLELPDSLFAVPS